MATPVVCVILGQLTPPGAVTQHGEDIAIANMPVPIGLLGHLHVDNEPRPELGVACFLKRLLCARAVNTRNKPRFDLVRFPSAVLARVLYATMVTELSLCHVTTG